MQTLSAYLLESAALNAQQLAERFGRVVEALAEWLQKKGATDPLASAGDFQSLTKNGNGSFVRLRHELSLGKIESVKLEEFTRAGQIFTTHVTATASHGKLRIHCTLSVANAATVVAPLPVDPRCPSILRSLLSASNDWNLNGWPIASGQPTVQTGQAGGVAVANKIRDFNRSLPIVVVSEIEGEQIWPEMAKELAFDLVGHADVVIVDEDATWALSDEVGKLHSCYRGAARLYWPPRKRDDGSIQFGSKVWTASDLVSNDRDGKGLSRLRAALRKAIMSTAALSIPYPAAAREIEALVANERIAELEKRSAPDSEELAIARLYLAENETLKNRIDQLESDLAKAAARAEAATHSLSQLKATEVAGDESDQSQAQEASTEPVSDETKYYKKIRSKGAYDVLVEVKGCDHTAWQNSASADKARKGLERLTGRNDWKSLLHCGTCTGGGMWKVRW